MPRSAAPPLRPKPALVEHQDHENQQPRQEDNTGRPLAGKQGTKGGTCRPWLIDGRGKAWSKRPDRQAGRHGRKRPPLRGAKTGTNHARPTSRPPAQPGACARHAGKVRGDREAAKNRLSGRRQASTVPKTADRAPERPQEMRSGRRAGVGLTERLRGLVAPPGAESVLFSGKAKRFQWESCFRAANHSPPPLASEGSESPSVVRGAGGGALRFLRLPPRLEALAVPVASRVRLRPRPHPFGARRTGCAPRAASGRALDTPSTQKQRGAEGAIYRPGARGRAAIQVNNKIDE